MDALRHYRNLPLIIKSVIWLTVLGALVTGMIEGACRSDSFYASQEWKISYGSSWVDASPLQNCRINLRNFGKAQLAALAKNPTGIWPELEPWHQWTVLSGGVITILFFLEAAVSLFSRKRRSERDGARLDKNEIRTAARRRL
jgi:hypothetical protein